MVQWCTCRWNEPLVQLSRRNVKIMEDSGRSFQGEPLFRPVFSLPDQGHYTSQRIWKYGPWIAAGPCLLHWPLWRSLSLRQRQTNPKSLLTKHSYRSCWANLLSLTINFIAWQEPAFDYQCIQSPNFGDRIRTLDDSRVLFVDHSAYNCIVLYSA